MHGTVVQLSIAEAIDGAEVDALISSLRAGLADLRIDLVVHAVLTPRPAELSPTGPRPSQSSPPIALEVRSGFSLVSTPRTNTIAITGTARQMMLTTASLTASTTG